MWIQRTSEEIAKWHKATEREACSHGRLMAGIIWALFSISAAGGWLVFISGTTGAALQRAVNGGFWLRLPIFALITLPFAYWIFRRERRKERAKILSRTVCPECDITGEGNAGTICKCGGAFVSSNTVKWIEKSKSR